MDETPGTIYFATKFPSICETVKPDIKLSASEIQSVAGIGWTCTFQKKRNWKIGAMGPKQVSNIARQIP